MLVFIRKIVHLFAGRKKRKRAQKSLSKEMDGRRSFTTDDSLCFFVGMDKHVFYITFNEFRVFDYLS